MLVIARKQHEFIQIGDDIVVKVIKTGRGSIKIGIDAPDGLRVLRGELVIDSDLDEAESTDEEPQPKLSAETSQPRVSPRRHRLMHTSRSSTMKAVGAL